MGNYPTIRNALSSFFSVQTGLDNESATAGFRRAFEADEELRREVVAAVSDEGVSWKEMLFNAEYEVFEADSEAEAKEYAMSILLAED